MYHASDYLMIQSVVCKFGAWSGDKRVLWGKAMMKNFSK